MECMSDDKKTSKAEELKATASPEPVSTDAKEPKQEERAITAAKPAGAKPATKPARKRVKDSVVGAGDTDTVAYSKARPARPTEGRKSLTVLHIQRALAELGFPIGAPTGRYDNTTRDAVISYQASLGGVATGLLSRDQFSALFEGDPNVTVFIDTHVDNT